VSRAQLFEDSQQSIDDEDDAELQKRLADVVQASLHTKKRRKLSHAPPEATEPETTVLFRLLSTPHPVSLLPPPPPPPVLQRKTRRLQSEAVAVDAEWVIQQSLTLPPPFRVGRLVLQNAPPLLHALCLQTPRKTRPPVPASVPPLAVKGPIIDFEAVLNPPQTRKRRRGKTRDRVRPQPTFWRPEKRDRRQSWYGMGHGVL
ncbi:hypothetical protein C8J57DRAFT_1289684, partial [Mycena rebaudengoi]